MSANLSTYWSFSMLSIFALVKKNCTISLTQNISIRGGGCKKNLHPPHWKWAKNTWLFCSGAVCPKQPPAAVPFAPLFYKTTTPSSPYQPTVKHPIKPCIKLNYFRLFWQALSDHESKQLYLTTIFLKNSISFFEYLNNWNNKQEM